MIICGHALIGKSTLARRESVCVDLESSTFCQGNFERYVEMVLALHQQGKVVLTSCHAAVRAELQKVGATYLLVLPHDTEKTRYYELAKARQPHPLRPDLVLSQWDVWQKHGKDENVYKLPVGKHLSDAFVVCGDGKFVVDTTLAAEKGVLVSSKLKTCPFCGGEAARFTIESEKDYPVDFGGDVVQCKKCFASTRVFFGEKKGILEAWNKRWVGGTCRERG